MEAVSSVPNTALVGLLLGRLHRGVTYKERITGQTPEQTQGLPVQQTS